MHSNLRELFYGPVSPMVNKRVMRRCIDTGPPKCYTKSKEKGKYKGDGIRQ
jgi:hypothetical protein